MEMCLFTMSVLGGPLLVSLCHERIGAAVVSLLSKRFIERNIFEIL